MSQGLVVRRPQVLPQPPDNALTISTNPRRRIIFRHPAYPPESAVLLTLPAFDHPDGGLYYETARVACGILANNRWDGYFTKDPRGPEIKPQQVNNVLPVGSDYFFCLPAGDSTTNEHDPYPIVPSFGAWQFPHGKLPPSWQRPSNPAELPAYNRSNVTLAVHMRDQSCRMSQYTDGCEKAHLCPVQEDAWFHENQMQTYVHDNTKTGRQAIYDVNNMLLLRSDLHKSFDAKKFAFVPKSEGDDPSNMQLITHMLYPSVELAQLYHNAVLQPIDSIPSEFLLARFAWALFPMIEGFLLTKAAKMLVTVGEGARMTSSDVCRTHLKPRTSQAKDDGQPQKRGRTDNGNGPQDDHCTEPESTKRIKHRPIAQSLTPPATIEVSPSLKASPRLAIEPAVSNFASAADEIDQLDGKSGTDHLDRMRERALEEERKRSDPQGHWMEEVEWAELELMQTRASPDSLSKMYEILGLEVLEARDSSFWARPTSVKHNERFVLNSRDL